MQSPAEGLITEQYLPIQLTAGANDEESGDLSQTITWSSDTSGHLETGAKLDLTLAVGTHTLTAQVTDPQGKTSTVLRTVTVNAAPQLNYCAAAGAYARRAWIERVSIAGVTNTSGTQGGYGDFTALGPIYVQRGANDIVLTPGFRRRTATENWSAWIDLNRDGQFSADELVLNAKTSRSVSGTFAIPDGADAGHTRMRILMRQDRKTDTCGSFKIGEVEDYAVVLLP